MNPSNSPSPVSPSPYPHRTASKPLALPLGKIGVAIVDDDENFHLFLRDILDQTHKYQWVGSYFSGEEALAGIPHSGAQVVLMDIKMPGISGIESARRLKALLPHLIIVMITGLDDPRTFDLARESGAERFLPKPFTAAHLLATLSFCILRPKVETKKPQASGKGESHRRPRGRSFTARENRLMEYMSEGLTNKEIADKTGVSKSAVDHMVTRIFKKLGVTNRTDAIRKWRNGNRRST